MRNPTNVLNSLTNKAVNKSYAFERLYRNLYNPEFYFQAYQNIYAKEGNMTEGTDGKTIDSMSIDRINQIIGRLKDESYQPNPVRRVYIDKKNSSKKRPLGIPSIDDKLIQEVIRMILESIYEPKFQDTSHGFRPGRSCHTALRSCIKRFNGVTWFVEGDIKGFFDNIHHETLIHLIRKTIKDEKFLNLIRKFLKSGYLEDWKYHNTYSGTPQGGIISPILSNIYLNELDSYMNKYKKEFDKGKERQVNQKYKTLKQIAYRFYKKASETWDEKNLEERKQINKEFKKLKMAQLKEKYADPMDETYKRIQYVRYADDFLIGVIGSKKDAEKVKADLTKYLRDELKLELSQEKTLITHSYNKAKFLGYEVAVHRSEELRPRKGGAKIRSINLVCNLYIPRDAWVNKLKELDALRIDKDGVWRAKCRTYLKNHDDLEIISIYNAELRGLHNYYKLAKNVNTLSKFKSFMKYSFLMTLASKYNSSIGKLAGKYRFDGQLGVKYQTVEGQKIRYFYNESFKVERLGKDDGYNVDIKPNTLIYNGRNSLQLRLLARTCEWCGETDVDIEMHHVRKLKNLSGKKAWEIFMISRRRKTLALCTKCHHKLHAGKLD